ncbi:MAG: translation elongation factor Ts [Francisella endosymbiont of Hyalomma asiaticum]
MSNISAKLVKELRERTGAGMMECKKALVAAEGYIEKAAEEMRISGQAKADKKASRVAAEGVIEVYAAYGRAILLEINSETDFVARDETFKAFAQQAVKAAHAANSKTIKEVLAAKTSNGETVEEARKSLIAKIGENIQVRRVKTVEANTLGVYIHGSKIGVVVALEGGDEDLAKDVAMHVAAANPMVVSGDQVPADVVAKEKEIFTAQAKESGKPAEIIEKMIVGRIRKFLDEVALLGQDFVKDPAIKVEKLVKDKGAKVVNFIRLDVGEGIEKKEEDFAAEVMSQIKG